MVFSLFWRRFIGSLVFLSLLPFVILISSHSLQNTDLPISISDTKFLLQDSVSKENIDDIYFHHKGILSSKISSSNLPVTIPSHLSYSDGEIESFHILTNDLNDYTS
ncbi:MAG: hypothetical protein ACW96U_07800, partial [Candidatus Heimdallarchaeaceae archaeon]